MPPEGLGRLAPRRPEGGARAELLLQQQRADHSRWHPPLAGRGQREQRGRVGLEVTLGGDSPQHRRSPRLRDDQHHGSASMTRGEHPAVIW